MTAQSEFTVAPNGGEMASVEEMYKNYLVSLAEVFEAAIAYKARPIGGQQCGPRDDPFFNLPPSQIRHLRKYAKEIRMITHTEPSNG